MLLHQRELFLLFIEVKQRSGGTDQQSFDLTFVFSVLYHVEREIMQFEPMRFLVSCEPVKDIASPM